MGGHGNGWWNSEQRESVRGVGIPTDLIAAMSYNMPGVHVFHTRLATAGGKKDDLCHPFPCGPDDDPWAQVLVHNGHWSDWWAYCDDSERSDTEAVASLVKKHGPAVLMNTQFLGAGMFAVINAEETLLIPRQPYKFTRGVLFDGGWFHSSEPCRTAFSYQSSLVVPAHKIWQVNPKTGLLNEVERDMPTLEDRRPARNAWTRYTGGGYWGKEEAGFASSLPGLRVGRQDQDETLYLACDCGVIERAEDGDDPRDFECTNCWLVTNGYEQYVKGDAEKYEEELNSGSEDDPFQNDFTHSSAVLSPYTGEIDEKALIERGIDPEAYGLPAATRTVNDGG